MLFYLHCDFRSFDKKGQTPPKKNLTEKRTELFPDGDVHFLRPIDSKSKSAAFVVLPGFLLTIQSFFFFEYIVGEREWLKVGCDQVPLFGMLARGYTPPYLLSLGSTPCWHDFTPFRHVADWYAPDWLKNTAGWRLVQLVVVVARRKDYVPRRNDQRPGPAQTWSAYVISIPQGLVR